MSSAATVIIVLIEDNQADAFLVEESLRESGLDFRLVRYVSGDEALQHFCPAPEVALETPDLILLDMHLPGTDGPEILRALRNEPRLMDVPIAIITGADLRLMMKTNLTGSTRFIRKSMDLDTYMREVSDGVRKILAQREASRTKGAVGPAISHMKPGFPGQPAARG